VLEADSERRLLLGGLGAATLALTSSGCALGGAGQATSVSYRWKEEVQLADGRVIIVEQGRGASRLYDGDRFNNEPTLGRLRFSLPEIQTAPIEWRDKFWPLILNVHEGVVYVAGSPFIGRHWDEFGRPRSGWVVQRYNPGTKGWDRVPASKTPISIRQTNLLIKVTPPEDIKLMTLQIKASKQFNGNIPTSPSYVGPHEIHPENLSLDPERLGRYAQGSLPENLTD
jgi:hypothetical protein